MSARLDSANEVAPRAANAGAVIATRKGMTMDGSYRQTTEAQRGPSAEDYHRFLRAKSQANDGSGFAPNYLPPFLFDFQGALVEWALRKGRAAIFADCGMGKTAMQLVWAENVVRETNRPVLILTPLAVAGQTVAEAAKFSIEARRSNGDVTRGIHVTNYEKLHHFNPADFAGVVCDESSILKSFDGVTKAAVTEFMRALPYRLLCTATAAPNDFVELGTSSEALGYLGHMDMLARFFKNDANTADTQRKFAAHGGGKPTWRFRGHAERPFWQWVCSWARSLRRPSDLGFSDARFVLPPLVEREHVVQSIKPRDGFLFAMAAHGLSEQREERRRTVAERCAKAAELVNATREPAVCWCHLNDEGDALERMIPDAVQVSGTDSDDEKERKFNAFQSGETRVLVIKPVIGAWGLNWQHCAHQTVFAGYSFEQYYQGIRRSWRFGQTRPVVVDHVASDGETEVLAARRRKAGQSDRMFAELVAHMRDGMAVERGTYGSKREEIPSWL